MKKLLRMGFLFLFLVVGLGANAQETFMKNDIADERASAYALVNATVYTDYKTKVEKGTVLIREGKIVAAGAKVSVPQGYTTIDVKGNYIYPSFIDMYTSYGLPKPDKGKPFNWGGSEVLNPQRKGAYNANDAIRSHFNASESYNTNAKAAKSMRALGFGAVLSYNADGLARGSSTMVTLGDQRANKEMIADKVAAHYSFSKGSSSMAYPISQMGFVALLRQTYMDAEWYVQERPFHDLTLESWNELRRYPQIFETKNKFQALAADKIGDEFNVQYILKGSGEEYQMMDEIKATRASFILPVNFPEPFEVDDPIETRHIALSEMKHWEMAPGNLKAMHDAGISFALTTNGLKKKSSFMANVRKAIAHGLPKEAALKALTQTPAELLQMSSKLGDLKKGKLANIIIASGDIFEKETKIYENWVQGKRFIMSDFDVAPLEGEYALNLDGKTYALKLEGKAGAETFKMEINDSTSYTWKVKRSGKQFTANYKNDDGLVRITGWESDKALNGFAVLPNGISASWKAEYSKPIEKEEKDEKSKEEEKTTPEVGKLLYPFMAYGNEERPTAGLVLIKNATVWTNESDGILENTDVLLKDGKISKIGKGLSAKGAKTIDGTGKHLTSGIIDEHTHIGAFSINDVATNSSMVRIGDNLDPEDINIYRQLSGGVVAAQILHGSANPVGGQSALIKMRWGASPQGMLIEGADQFIKFALGENVKRSWNNNSIRYPQTRMGVEQVYMDGFSNARAYEQEWNAYSSLKDRSSAIKPRRDLVDEAMLEILNKERFISCHSYVQSEINMLMKVAEHFDFNINTFTHILEGYKVADKMKAHGVGASTFADWWAYKWEVRYAIPYNATIMHNEGVTVAINSDDAEMGRRLNQEAAKSVKYGGMSEEDAWKMVTLNPAKLLHLDDTMGSIKTGKSADVVLWSDNPLSIYAKAEKTFVDGVLYFDIEEDLAKREAIAKERARLIQKMKGSKGNGGKRRKPMAKPKLDLHCDDLVFHR